MHIRQSSARQHAGRVVRGGKGSHLVLALAVLGVTPQVFAQEIYTWVGGAPQEQSEVASYGGLFQNWTPLARASRWEAGSIGSLINWRLSDNSIPGTTPGPSDTVVFGTGFGSGNPLSRENREIHQLIVNTPSDIVLDFRDQDGDLNALIIRSGRVTTNSSVAGQVGFVGNMLIANRDLYNNPTAVDGEFNLTGKSIEFRGGLQVSGSLIKKGPQTLDLASNNWQYSVSGNLRIDDGTISVYTPSIGGDIFVGDGLGAADSARLEFVGIGGLNADRTLTNLNVKKDGFVYLYEVNRFSSITVAGGELRFTQADVYAPGLVAGPGTTGEAAVIGFDVFFGSKLDLSGSATSVIELTGTAETDDALHLNTRLVAPNLLVKGTGILTFGGTTGGVGASPLVNSINQTTIESGTVKVNRAMDDKVLGTNITIGKAGESKPARLHLNAAVPFDAATDVTLHQNGRFTVFNTTIDTLAFNGGGLVDSEGARSLTVNANATTVTGTNAVATVQPNRITFNSTAHELNVGSTNTLVISGAVTANQLSKTGAGTLRFGGAGADSIASLFVQSGTVELNRASGQNLAPGVFSIGLLNVSGPAIKWLASNQLADSQSLTFNSGSLNLNGAIETIGGFTAASTGTKTIDTGAGTLGIAGSVTVNQGALVSTTGNIDLVAGTRSFSAGGNFIGQPGFTNLKFAGAINNGTFNKTGVGAVEFNTVTGTATLALANGKAVSTGSTQFGGLTGSAPLEVQSGIFAVSNSSGQTSTYSGPISGPGGFHKRGAGELILGGTTPNTFTGGTTVANGTLVLDRDYDAIGDTTIAAAATVITRRDIQFYSESDVTVFGTLDLDGTLQSIKTLTLDSTNPGLDATVSSGRILTTGAVKARNGSFSNVALTVDSGGLELDDSDAYIRGNIAGNSSLKNNSSLLVQTLGADATALRFQNNLSVADGSMLLFVLPGMPNTAPLIDVDGSLLISSPAALSGFDLLAASNGVVTINLALNFVPLADGEYALLQFGDDTSNPIAASNFLLVAPPGGQGHLFVDNNTLYYTNIPEPASLSLLGVAASALLRRRPRR